MSRKRKLLVAPIALTLVVSVFAVTASAGKAPALPGASYPWAQPGAVLPAATPSVQPAPGIIHWAANVGLTRPSAPPYDWAQLPAWLPTGLTGTTVKPAAPPAASIPWAQPPAGIIP